MLAGSPPQVACLTNSPGRIYFPREKKTTQRLSLPSNVVLGHSHACTASPSDGHSMEDSIVVRLEWVEL